MSCNSGPEYVLQQVGSARRAPCARVARSVVGNDLELADALERDRASRLRNADGGPNLPVSPRAHEILNPQQRRTEKRPEQNETQYHPNPPPDRTQDSPEQIETGSHSGVKGKCGVCAGGHSRSVEIIKLRIAQKMLQGGMCMDEVGAFLGI